LRLDEALNTELLASNTLTALVARRIYPDDIPENIDQHPIVVFQEIDRIRDHTHEGDSAFVTARIQCTIIAKSRASAKATASVVRAILQDYSGVMGGTGGVNIQDIQTDVETDSYNPTVKVYETTVDFLIKFDEE